MIRSFKIGAFLPRFAFAVFWCLAIATPHAKASERTFRVYIDADFDQHNQSARSIEMGVRTALSHSDLHPEGVKFEIVPRNHRGNSKRSFLTMRAFSEDPDGLAVIGGIQSPPYLSYREQINEMNVLLMLPWSAAGPITRTDQAKNWIFRVSVDDTKAGSFLVERAIDQGACTKPAIVVFNSGWGRYNLGQIKKSLETRGISNVLEIALEGSATAAEVRIAVRDLSAAGADCVLAVPSTRWISDFVREVAALPQTIRIFTHWSTVSSDLAISTSDAERRRVDLRFLLTCLPFESGGNPSVHRATEAARALFPDEFESIEQLKVPIGFVHGYDVALLMLAALRSIPLDGPAYKVRERMRTALEDLEQPVEGLMKTYVKPFAPIGVDAHEALGLDDLCLARYDANGRITFAPMIDVRRN